MSWQLSLLLYHQSHSLELLWASLCFIIFAKLKGMTWLIKHVKYKGENTNEKLIVGLYKIT